MYPPILSTCVADAAVTALLGTLPTRLYQFGKAPQGVAKPYATWQQITGSPENYIDCPPDIDSYDIQIDVYADTDDAARDVVWAMTNAIQEVAYITSWDGESKDPDTNNSRATFSVNWWVPRP